jgi:hypothetical protein
MGTLYDMKLEDIRREILRFRFDPAYRGHDNRVPIDAFAKFVGVSRQTLYALMARHQAFDLAPRTRSRIVMGICMVLDGMRWRRREKRWSAIMPDGSLPVPPVKPGERGDGHAHV